MTTLTPIAQAVQAHSKYGFSGQSRTLVCGGSIPMSEGMPNPSNPAAELGTAVHELGENSYKLGLSCHDFVGCTFNKIEVTEDMAEAGQVYVNYIRQLKQQRPNASVWLELKVCLSSISNELWGTSDYVMLDGDTLIIGDYKNGYGVVEVDGVQTITGFGQLDGNAQTMGYALAAMDTLGLWGRVNKIITFICQPNVDHVNGVIRSKEYNMDEVTLWHQGYRAAHKRTDLVAGKHCKYCLAAGFCATRIKRTMELIGLTSSITKLNEDQIIELLDEIDTIKRTADAIADQATLLARQGKKLKGRKLVKAIVWAKCTDESELVKQLVEDAVHERFSDEFGTTEQDIELFISEFKPKLFNTPKLKGMTALKKVKGVDKDLVNKYFVKPDGGTVLVPIYDKRAAIMPDMRPDASGVFSAVTE